MSVRLRFLFVLMLGAWPLVNHGLRAQQAPLPAPLSQALSVMIGSGIQLQDMALTGDVQFTLGSTVEQGTITMLALVDGSTRYDITLPDRTIAESVFLANSRWQGNRKDATGVVGQIAPHNLLVDAAWFSPALVLQRYGLAIPTGGISALGIVQWHGNTLIELESTKQASTGFPSTDKEFERLSRTDLFLDPNTFMPAVFTYKTHPEFNARVNVPVEFRFSDYKAFDGVLVPQRVQRYVQGALNLDIHITSVQINTGLLVSQFPL